jgi:ABC-type branched-subunit amino acid transport system ATPase component
MERFSCSSCPQLRSGCSCARILNLDRAITVLLIEHDLAAAFRIADRVTAMDQGRVVAEGTPDEIRKESSLRRIYMGAGAAAPKNGAARG